MRPAYEDAAEVLRRADAVMQSAQPAFVAGFTLGHIRYRCRFEYPGVLHVFDRDTGELVVRAERGERWL